MDPRKKSSRGKKSTNLPVEFVDNVNELFTKTFKKQLKGRKIVVEGRIYPDEILFSVGFKESEKALRQTNFEASMDHKGQHILKKLSVCVDAVSSMMDQYFEAGEDLDLPKHWQAFNFDKDSIYLQSTGRNSELEAQANKILGHERGDELIIAPEEDPDNLVGTDVLDEEIEADDGSDDSNGGHKH
jgi:hypothetical protein